jgi:uncharacterized protein (DUF427 family)
VRVAFGGQIVADTTRVALVWESPHYPTYYFPRDDVRSEVLEHSATTAHSPSRGDATYCSVHVGDRVAPDAVWGYPDSPMEELRGLVRFDWEAMDHWWEEDEEVHVHARDPYTRVDILGSSRHVQVVIDGVVVADSVRPTLLFETGLPTRYYLPLTDVRLDLLEASTSSSRCPYKGTASYWSVRVGEHVLTDVAWFYPMPLFESIRIAGLVAFYNDRVDLVVDGETLVH